MKTRLLGFNRGGETTADPFGDVAASTATPLLEAWVSAPPRASGVTSSWVAALTTSGPVMNMLLVVFTMMMKSVIAGE